MNLALAQRLAGEAGVSIFDIFGLGTSLALNPASFGLTNAADACGAVSGANCSTYAYWDGIHPTTRAHEIIAENFLALAAPAPEPATWAMMLIGFGAVVVVMKRRRSAVTATAAAA